MGCISDFDLRQTAPPPGQPVPVGSADARESRRATLIHQPSGKDWEYGKEVSISVWLNRLLEMPAKARILYWSGIEIKCAKPEYEKHDVVLALMPCSYNWYAAAKLKRTLHATREELEEKVAAALNNSGSVAEAFRELTFDPFEKHTGWQTARFDDPMRLHWENGQRLGEGYLLGRNPNWSYHEKPSKDGDEVEEEDHAKPPGTPMWYFGICSDAPAAAQWLYETIGLELLQQTDDDVIFDHIYKRWKVSARVGGAGGEDIRIPRRFVDTDVSADVRKLPVSAAGREVSERLARGSIWQAMAGRADGSETTLETAVRRIYIAHLSNFLKRESRLTDWEELGEKVLEALRRGKKPLDGALYRKLLRRVSPGLRKQLEGADEFPAP